MGYDTMFTDISMENIMHTENFIQSFNQPINRLIMINGVVYYAIECDNH